MNPQLRTMIGEEAYQMLQKADDKTLDSMRYVVIDETCKTTFYETSGKGAKILFSNVKGLCSFPSIGTSTLQGTLSKTNFTASESLSSQAQIGLW